MHGEELQAVQVQLDPAPRMRGQQLSEVVAQLILAERVNLVGKVLADASHAARVGVDGLGLQALELEVLQVGLVLPIEMLRVVRHDCNVLDGWL